MARLLMEGDLAGLPDIPLQPGVTRLGRSEDNDFQISDESVSSHHCEIELKEGVITVRDLGSTNGTFLDGRQIQEAVLQPGQVLILGTMRMACQADPAGEPAAVACSRPPVVRAIPPLARTAALPASGGAGAEVCAEHPAAAAQWRCVSCDMMWCPACVKTTVSGVREYRSCPKCGSSCVSFSEYTRLKAPPITNFFDVWLSAFAYPVKKDGLILLGCGTVLFGLLEAFRTVLDIVKFFGLFMMLAYIIVVVTSAGYTFAFMQNIIQSTAQGDEAMPDWPDISGFHDSFTAPFFRFGLTWFVCLAPGLAVMGFVSPYAGVPVLLLGLFCLPMAILTVSLADSIAGFNPIIIFSGIGKAPLPYLATCGIFIVIIGLVHGLHSLMDWLGIPILPTVICTFLWLYGLAVEMRLLGLFYLANKSKLAWFE
jgi:hypothetical protein